MLKYSVKFSFLLALFSLCFFSACKDTATSEEQEVEAFVDQALLSVAAEASVGADGCYELIFPVTIEFTDGTTAEVNSVDEMKEAFRTWKAANPDATRRDKPTLALPVEFLSDEGEVITASTKEELIAIRIACGDRPPHRRKGKRGGRECSCFDIQFPITILFPDDTTAEVNDRAEFKSTIRAWKAANPDATERPEVVFPITVVLEDGTSVEVNSLDELKALKEECRNGE